MRLIRLPVACAIVRTAEIVRYGSIVGSCALLLGGCADLQKAANQMAAMASTVLAEDFEAPVTVNYTVFKAGQSFTTNAATWQVEAASVDLVNAQVRKETVAFDGNQLVDLAGSPGAGVISTSFATTGGQSYTLSFRYARNNNVGKTVARARVEVRGAKPLLQAEVSHDPAKTAFAAQQIYSGNFVADGAQATLRFTSLNAGNAGVTIDGITVMQAAASP